MNNLPYIMHPRYNEFLEFMRDCPHRQSASSLEVAFWVWMNMQDSNIESLKTDLDRLHRERDSFQQQCAAMASENERLNDELMQLKRNISIALDYGAVTERGDACLAIDGGNL